MENDESKPEEAFDIEIRDGYSLGNDLFHQQKSNLFCDVTILTIEGFELPAHVCVLAAASPTLEEGFKVDSAGAAPRVLETSIHCSLWESILKFLYTGNLHVNSSDVPALMDAAAALGIQRLLDLSDSFGRFVDMKQEEETLTAESHDEGSRPAADDPGSPNVEEKNELLHDMSHVELANEDVTTQNIKVESKSNVELTNDGVVMQQFQVESQNSFDVKNEETEKSSNQGWLSNFKVFLESSSTTNSKAEKQVKTRQLSAGTTTSVATKQESLAGENLELEETGNAEEYTVEFVTSDHVPDHSEEFGSETMLEGQNLEQTNGGNEDIDADDTLQMIDETDTTDAVIVDSFGTPGLTYATIAEDGTAILDVSTPVLDSSDVSHGPGLSIAETAALYDAHVYGSENDGPVVLFEEFGLDVYGTVQYRCTLCSQLCSDTQTHSLLHVQGVDKPHVCEICKKKYKTNSHLRHHMLIAHSKTKECSCPECGKKFRNIYLMKRHLSSVCNTTQKSFTCPICHKSFRTSFSLNYHVATHSAARPFKCHLCPKAYASKPQLRAHQVYHQQTNCTCFCGKVFTSDKLYKAHFKYKHAPPARFQCKVCGKACGTKGHLNVHLKSHDRPFSCQVCLKGYTDELQCQQHELKCQLGIVSTSEGNVRTCTVCGTTFVSLNELYKHMEEHSDSTLFPCQQCNRQFSSFKTYLNHIRGHFTPRLECSECGKSFQRPAGLRIHMMSHKKEFQCNLCLETFSHSKALAGHINRHKRKDVIEYVCSFCDECFHSVSAISRHQELAHAMTCQEPSLSCHFCDKLQCTEASFVHHLRSNHSGETSFCETCQIVYLTPLAHRKHNALRHASGSVSHPCTLCQWNFYDKEALLHHESVSHKAATGLLQKQAQAISYKTQFCFICLERFNDAKLLAQHEESHLSEKEYQCPFCSYAGVSFVDVKSHAKRCTKIRRCKTCNIQFSTMNQLYKHVQLHKKGAIVFACNTCGDKFKNIDLLKNHKLACTGMGCLDLVQLKNETKTPRSIKSSRSSDDLVVRKEEEMMADEASEDVEESYGNSDDQDFDENKPIMSSFKSLFAVFNT